LASKARSRSRSVFSVGIFECRHFHASKDVDLVYFCAANLSAEAEADLERRLRLYFKLFGSSSMPRTSKGTLRRTRKSP
jgi:hypothetical protein